MATTSLTRIIIGGRRPLMIQKYSTSTTITTSITKRLHSSIISKTQQQQNNNNKTNIIRSGLSTDTIITSSLIRDTNNNNNNEKDNNNNNTTTTYNNNNSNNIILRSYHSSTKIDLNQKQQYSKQLLSEEDIKRELPYADIPLMEKTTKSIFQKFYDKYSFKQQTNRILIAESFLQAATHQASNPRWYYNKNKNGCNISKNDFRSYQGILTLHIWLLHKRLISDNNDPYMAALIQEELFDILWTDTTNRMRHYGISEMLINKNLKKVQNYTFIHCFHYDQCYTSNLLNQPTKRLKELKNLVKKHILLLDTNTTNTTTNTTNDTTTTTTKDDDAVVSGSTSSSTSNTNTSIEDDDRAERIAWYIETQYQNIVHDWPDELYQLGRVAWVDLPNFNDNNPTTNNEVNDNDTDNDIDDDDILPKPWVSNIANDGVYYYWNTETRESTWEKPTITTTTTTTTKTN